MRWERNGDRVSCAASSSAPCADDSLPDRALGRREQLRRRSSPRFPIQAFARDSATYVIDVTDFFGGDTPGISGLTAAQRRQYQVRRLDPARSYINTRASRSR